MIVSSKQTRENSKRAMERQAKLDETTRALNENAVVTTPTPRNDLDTLTESFRSRRSRQVRKHTSMQIRKANIHKANAFLEQTVSNLLAQVAYAAFPASDTDKEAHRDTIIAEAAELFMSDACNIAESNPLLKDLTGIVYELSEAFDPNIEFEESGFSEYVTVKINNALKEEGSDLQCLLVHSVKVLRESVLEAVTENQERAKYISSKLQEHASTVDNFNMSEDAAMFAMKRVRDSFEPTLMESCFKLVSKHAESVNSNLSEAAIAERKMASATMYLTIIETASMFGLFGNLDMVTFVNKL